MSQFGERYPAAQRFPSFKLMQNLIVGGGENPTGLSVGGTGIGQSLAPGYVGYSGSYGANGPASAGGNYAPNLNAFGQPNWSLGDMAGMQNAGGMMPGDNQSPLDLGIVERSNPTASAPRGSAGRSGDTDSPGSTTQGAGGGFLPLLAQLLGLTPSASAPGGTGIENVSGADTGQPQSAPTSNQATGIDSVTGLSNSAATPAAQGGSALGWQDYEGFGAQGANQILSFLGQREARKDARRASQNAERARQDAMAAVSPQQLMAISNWLFGPDLLGPAPTEGQPEARAHGGPVEPNKPYLVGEQGPEVIVPGQSGTVLPNPSNPAPAVDPSEYTGPGTSPGALHDTGGSEGLHNHNIHNVRPGGTPTRGAKQTFPPIGGPPPTNNTPTANVANPPPEASNQPLGGLVTQRSRELLENPGQTTQIAYDRGQENANATLNTALGGIMGTLSGQGLDPNSPMGQMLMQSATLNAGNMRNEALRDQNQLEEGLRRQDIAQGTSNYLQDIQLLLSYLGLASAAAGGTAFPQVAPIDPYQPLTQGIGSTSYFLQGVGGGSNSSASGSPYSPEARAAQGN